MSVQPQAGWPRYRIEWHYDGESPGDRVPAYQYALTVELARETFLNTHTTRHVIIDSIARNEIGDTKLGS